jgi:hypothetical protein
MENRGNREPSERREKSRWQGNPESIRGRNKTANFFPQFNQKDGIVEIVG